MFAVLGLIPIRLADSQCWQSESCLALCTAAAPAAVTRGVELSDYGFMYTLLARLVKFFLILVFVCSGNELLLIDHCFWCCVCVWALLIVAKLLVYADIIVEVVSLSFFAVIDYVVISFVPNCQACTWLLGAMTFI